MRTRVGHVSCAAAVTCALLLGVATAQPTSDESARSGKAGELAEAFGERLTAAARRVDGVVSYHVIAVMTSFLADETEGDRTITGMSRDAYRYFHRLARAGREGRLR